MLRQLKAIFGPEKVRLYKNATYVPVCAFPLVLLGWGGSAYRTTAAHPRPHTHEVAADGGRRSHHATPTAVMAMFLLLRVLVYVLWTLGLKRSVFATVCYVTYEYFVALA